MYKLNNIEVERNAKRWNAFFDKLIEEKVSPCFSVALLHDQEIVYTYAMGLEQNGGKSIGISTQFNIGSVSKTITGALIIKLLEQGRLSLNDKVITYIPEFKSDEVTILHLMTHTGGFASVDGLVWPRQNEWKAFMEKIYEVEPEQSPGQASVYYTYGYCILMDILQRITGEGIARFAKRELFDLLGMNDTTFDLNLLQAGNYVLPCRLEENKWDISLDRIATTADSGLYSTSFDLLKFTYLFLHGGTWGDKQIYSQASIDLMMTEATGNRFAKTPIFWMKTEVDSYLCFGDLNSSNTVAHPGFSGCMLFIDPKYRMAGAIITNSQRLHSNFLNYNKIINILMSV